MYYIFNINPKNPGQKAAALILYKSDRDPTKEQLNILVVPDRRVRPNKKGIFPKLSGVHQHYVDLKSLNRQLQTDETGFNLTNNSMQLFGPLEIWIPPLNPSQIATIFNAVDNLLHEKGGIYTFILVNQRGSNRRTCQILNIPQAGLVTFDDL